MLSATLRHGGTILAVTALYMWLRERIDVPYVCVLLCMFALLVLVLIQVALRRPESDRGRRNAQGDQAQMN